MAAIPDEQVVEQIKLDNSWWAEPHQISPVFSQWAPRPYLNAFHAILTSKVDRAVVLMGPRRVGKTVLLHHAVGRLLAEGITPRQILLIAVDRPLYARRRLGELLDFYARAAGVNYREERCFIFFDEIQYLYEWERHLKVLVDERTPSRFAVSGSAAAALRLKSRESGAGRFTDFLLPPLTFHEYLQVSGKDSSSTVAEPARLGRLNQDFVSYLSFGGYPEVVVSPEVHGDPLQFIKNDIIDKVLMRDLPGLYGIQDTQELNGLFTTLAYQTGQEISMEGLAQDSHVAKNTLKKYLEYLEAAFLIKIVHRIDRSAKRFQRANRFKVYLTNPSIRTALFGPLDADHAQIGMLVETAVFAQWFHTTDWVHYARWPEGEIDLVVPGPNFKPSFVMEIKWSDRLDERILKGLVSFCRQHEISECWLTSRSEWKKATIDGVTVIIVPVSEAVLAWGQAIADVLHKGERPRRSIVPPFEAASIP